MVWLDREGERNKYYRRGEMEEKDEKEEQDEGRPADKTWIIRQWQKTDSDQSIPILMNLLTFTCYVKCWYRFFLYCYYTFCLGVNRETMLLTLTIALTIL